MKKILLFLMILMSLQGQASFRKSGIRFVYQKYEIALGAAEVIKGDVSFSEIRQFLSDESRRY